MSSFNYNDEEMRWITFYKNPLTDNDKQWNRRQPQLEPRWLSSMPSLRNRTREYFVRQSF